jgi:DNA-binding MarR family transcriptional regulator
MMLVKYLIIKHYPHRKGPIMNDQIERSQVAEQLMYMQGLLRRRFSQHMRRREPWADPRQGQGRVLALLRLTPEVTQKELAFLLNMSKQALAELLGKLEHRGFIEREPSEQDRRVTNIKLTDQGREAAETVDPRAPGDRKASFLDALDDQELTQFSEYLTRIIDRLEEQVGAMDPGQRREMVEEFWRRRGGHPGGHHGGRHGHPVGPRGDDWDDPRDGFGHGFGPGRRRHRPNRGC